MRDVHVDVLSSNPLPVTQMRRYRTEALLGLALVALTLAAHGRAVFNGFINYDDNDYVVQNRHVLSGLSWNGIVWAFTTTRAANWHPLTWLSLQLDATLFGRDAWGFHLTNVLLHTANTVLLFVTLRRLTGAVALSAVVAAFFGVHPLHVESVAWVAERKDVLSALFWLLTMLAYARYVERPGAGRYLLVLVLFALGLLAKPMLVTLPCVLLLLDYWPLKRLGIAKDGTGAPWGRVLLEKLPLFTLTAAACVVTVYAQRRGGAVSTLEQLPFAPRLLNTINAYAAYLGKTFWPTKLAVFYPHPREGIDVAQTVRAALLLGVITLAVVLFRRRSYLAVGWFWFLGTLVPVIGLVQVGSQAMADRYTYIPHIGLFVAIAWGVADLTTRWPRRRLVLTTVTVIGLTACTALTVWQVSVWHNSTWLWEWALQVTRDNATAHNSLGDAYFNSVREDRLEKSREQFQKALALAPRNAKAHNNLGTLALEEGRYEDAITSLKQAAALDPSLAQVPDNWGVALRRQGQYQAAAEKHRHAIALNPDVAAFHANLGYALLGLGETTEAVAALRQAVRLVPRSAPYRAGLAWALWHQGEREEARRLYDAVLADQPTWAEKTRRAAWRWAASPQARLRSAPEALRLAEQLVQAEGETAESLDLLAAAQAEAGDFASAATTARRAADLAEDDTLRAAITRRREGYEARRPYREEATD